MSKQSLFRAGLGIMLMLLLSFASAFGSTEIIRNGDFETGLQHWNVNPALTVSNTWPLVRIGENQAINMHPADALSFFGTVIYQNLNVNGIESKQITVSMSLLKEYPVEGNSIALYLTFVRSGSTQRVKVLNPTNSLINPRTDNTSAFTKFTAQYTFPNDATKLVKVEIVKESYGYFYVDNVSITGADLTTEPIPTITSLTTTSGNYGSVVTINGSNFNLASSNSEMSYVSIGGSKDGITINNWTDNAITITINEPARSGQVMVVQNAVEADLAPVFYNVTSPTYYIDVMQSKMTVIKGQPADYVVRVAFKNNFSLAANENINFSVIGSDLSANAQFLPSPPRSSGGILMRINTANLAQGLYEGKIRAQVGDGVAREVRFELEIVTTTSVKFQKLQNYQPVDNITTLTVNTQGVISDINAVAFLSDGGSNPVDLTIVTNNSNIVYVHKTQWGITYYAKNNGTATITAQSPDGILGTLTITVNIPDSPKVTNIFLTPDTITNKYTDNVTFYANGTHSLAYGVAGMITFVKDSDTRGWIFAPDDYSVVSGNFKVDHSQTDLGTYLFSASTLDAQSNYTTTNVAALVITNDPSYSSASGSVKSVDPTLQEFAYEMFDFQLYNAQTGELAFTKTVHMYHGQSVRGFNIGGIEPGTYKVKVVSPQGNFAPVWYGGAKDFANAQPVVFQANQPVNNLFFFVAKPDNETTDNQTPTTTYTLTVNKSGTGVGTVISTPTGINCGSDCTEAYVANTVVNLVATPDAGSTFVGWSGACTGTGTCTVTMDASKTVTALFDLAASQVSGACGSANGGTFTTLTQINPSLCRAGTVANFAGTGPWTWQCVGSNGGSTATCSADKQQVLSEYTVTGTVTNPSNQTPISGVTVVIKNENNTIVATVQTNNAGIYTAELPSAGDYTISAFKTGFTEPVPQVFALTENSKTTVINFAMFASNTGGDVGVLNLQQGWNFVTFPKLPSPNGSGEASVANVFGADASKVRIIWSFEQENWKSWKPGSNANTLTNIKYGFGYWVYMSQQVILDMSAWTAKDNKTVALQHTPTKPYTWNLVGYQGQPKNNAKDAINAVLSNKWVAIWTWENGMWQAEFKDVNASIESHVQSITTGLQPGKAYWILVSDSVLWDQNQ